MKIYISLILIFLLGGCVEIATSVAINTGVQLVGEKYLISQKKPVIKCNAINVLKGNKFDNCHLQLQFSRSCMCCRLVHCLRVQF